MESGLHFTQNLDIHIEFSLHVSKGTINNEKCFRMCYLLCIRDNLHAEGYHKINHNGDKV